MSASEQSYLNTKKDLRAALQRLVSGCPTNPELKERLKKGTLKINNSSVEKEAGKGNQSLKRHEDVKDEILLTQQKPNTETVISNSVDVKSDPLYKDILKKFKKAKEKNKMLQAELISTKEQLTRKEVLLQDRARHHDEIIAALWRAIPRELIDQDLIKEIENATVGNKNVIDFPKQ
jgi:hypothetical protein